MYSGLKMKSLRDQYIREKGKVTKTANKSGSGSNDVYVSKWVHFGQLQFLEEHMMPKNTISNLEVQNQNYYTFKL